MERLSWEWRTVLKKLSEYGDEGVDRDLFVDLVGGGELVRNNPADRALSQMFFSGVEYYETVPPAPSKRIRITQKGREALGDD